MKHRSAFRIMALLTLALAALVMLALACGPSAPAEQGEKPTPTPTPVTIPDDTYVGPMARARVNQAAQSDGKRAADETIQVITRLHGELAPISDLVTSNGGVVVKASSLDVTLQIPVSLLPILAAHPEVIAVMVDEAEFPYPSLNRTLNDVVAAWQSGASPEEAADYAFFNYEDMVFVVVLSLNAEERASLESAKQLLFDDNDVWFNYSDYIDDDGAFGIFVPVALLPELAQIPGNEYLSEPWGLQIPPSTIYTEEELEVVDIIMEKYLSPALPRPTRSTPQPESASKSSPGVTGSNSSEQVSYQSEGVTRHSADAWHEEDLEGQGVKVGIVDWGFGGFSAPATSITVTNPVTGTIITVPVPAIIHPKLPQIDLGANGNAHCPLIGEDVPAAAVRALKIEERPCHLNHLDHGTSAAEAVHDVAPEATLLMARATSLNELKDGVDWLISKEADVIVHAAGWPYDGPGDGASPFDGTITPNEVSPLNTVDKAIRNNITWVNAAGNQALYTWTKTSSNYTVHDEQDLFENQIIFRPGETQPEDKTCLSFDPHGPFSFYFYHLRWADDWPSSTNTGAKFDLDLKVEYGFPGGSLEGSEQWGTSYPLDGVNDLLITGKRASCLRVTVNPPAGQTNAKPAWVQVQIFTSKRAFDPGITNTPQGMSIVNPAESNNPGLIAVAAADLRNSAAVPPITNYSSRGPVLAVGTTGDFSRAKPDLAGGSHGVNWVKRDGETDDERRFGGTSQAAGHMGGLAALVVQQLRLEREDDNYRPPPEMVADRLKSYGVYPSSTVARAIIIPPAGIDTNQWGAGFVKLPSPTAVPVRPTGLSGGGHHRRVALQVWTDFDVPVAANTYTDATVESGKTYIYRVAALKSNNKGSTSSGAEVTIPLRRR